MVGIFIDANIFLEVQLEQEKADECEKLLTHLETAPPCSWTTSFLVFSMTLTLLHRTGDNDKVTRFIKSMNSYTGLKLYHPGYGTISQAIDEMEKNQLDFDDGLAVASMNKLQITDIVTFDEHFEKVPGINILSPSEALKKLTEKDENENKNEED